MKPSSFRALSLAAFSAMALGHSIGLAATVSDAKRGMPVQAHAQAQPNMQPQTPVVLPARTEVLSIDWVDTKNAKIAIGGITYALFGALPQIVLASGEQVTNIGYLKSGMRVRIRTAPEAAGHARLVEITVVG